MSKVNAARVVGAQFAEQIETGVSPDGKTVLVILTGDEAQPTVHPMLPETVKRIAQSLLTCALFVDPSLSIEDIPAIVQRRLVDDHAQIAAGVEAARRQQETRNQETRNQETPNRAARRRFHRTDRTGGRA